MTLINGHKSIPPILLLIFNRPDTTAKVMDVLRCVKPNYLYIAADGPNKAKPDEEAKTESAREVALTIDWPCEVKTLFRKVNLGCGRAVSSAIDWFFENVEEGIILEDDCVPDISYFKFAQELLERYRNDKRVMVISANHFQGSKHKIQHSYFFSRYNHCWGWASWRRAWQLYDFNMSLWPALRESDWLLGIGNGSRPFQRYWTIIFDKVYDGEIDTWDYQWAFSCWAQNGMSILPALNLVTNIGFGANATHTNKSNKLESYLELHSMDFPLSHPPCMVQDVTADKWSDRHLFGISNWTSIKYLFRNLPGSHGLANFLFQN